MIDQLELDYALGQRRFQRYPDDCARIVKVARDLGECHLSHRDAEHIWEWHSDQQCAGWLFIPKDDKEIIEVIQDFIRHRSYQS